MRFAHCCLSGNFFFFLYELHVCHFFQLYTKKVSLDPSVDMQAIATSCNGYVGADLEALCREAAISASKRCSDSLILTLQDFKTAKSLVGPSITRGITVEIPKVTWDDVGGLKDLKVNTLIK